MLRWITVIGFTFLFVINLRSLFLTEEDIKKSDEEERVSVQTTRMLLASPTFERLNLFTLIGILGMTIGLSYFPLVYGLALNGTTVQLFLTVMVVFFVDLLVTVFWGYDYVAKKALRDGWYEVHTRYGSTNPFMNRTNSVYKKVWAVVWMANYLALIYISATNL